MSGIMIDEEVYKMLIDNSQCIYFQYNVLSDEIVFYNTFSHKSKYSGKTIIKDYIKNLDRGNYIDNISYELYVKFLRGQCSESVDFLGKNYFGQDHVRPYVWYTISGKCVTDSDGNKSVAGMITPIDKNNSVSYKNYDYNTSGNPIMLHKIYAVKAIKSYLKNRAPNECCTIIMVDMDHFTDINDKCGARFADAVILETIDIMLDIFSKNCLFSRLGGDEILIFAENKSSQELKDKAELFAERIADICPEIRISASIALVDTHDAGMYYEMYDLVRTVISYIKKNGGNAVSTYSEASAALGRPVEELYAKHCMSIHQANRQISYNDNIVSYAMALLEDTRNIKSSINMLISRIGKVYRADRISITSVKWSALDFKYEYEWCRNPEQKKGKIYYKISMREYYNLAMKYSNRGLFIEAGASGSVLEAAIYNRGQYAGTLRIEKQDDSYIWSDSEKSNAVLLANLIGTYISREEGERDLKRKQFEMKVMSTAIKGGYKIVLDDDDRTILDISNELCGLFGYSKDEFFALTDGIERNMIYPEDLISVYENEEDIRIHNTDSYTIKYRVRCRDGSLKWILDSGSRLVDDNGRTVFYSTCIDITETESISAHIEELYSQAKAREEFIKIALGNTKKADFYYYPAERKCIFPKLSCRILECKPLYTDMPFDFVSKKVDPKMRRDVIEAFEKIASGERTAQCVFKLKNSELWIKITLSAIKRDNDDDSLVVVGIAEDISDVTSMDQEKTRIIQSISDTYFAMYHVKVHEGIYTTFKQRKDTERAIDPGGEYSKFIQKYADKFVVPEYREDFKKFTSIEHAKEVLNENNRIESFEYQRIYHDRVGWVRISMILESITDGVLDSFMLSATDIEEAKLREFERKQEHRLLSLAISDSYDSIYEIQLDTDTVYEVEQKNGTVARQSRTESYTELSKKMGMESIHPDELERYIKTTSIDYFDKMITEEKPTLYQEFRVKSGEKYIWKSYTYRLIPDDRGKSIMQFVNNIDERKRHELEVQQALQSAFDSANAANTAKSDFLSKMSHDIRTPMNAIIGMTAIARSNIGSTDKVQYCLDKIDVSSKHLLSLINEVLDMSKIESGKIDINEEEVNLSDLIDGLVTMIQPQIEKKKHKLRVNLSGVIHENIIGDSLRIQQVFVNLMSNAVKYTPDGGIIELSISEHPSQSEDTGLFEFVFKDNGIGMTKEFVERIFDPFSRAEDSRISKIQGTGLGMAITKNIVRMMNGDIKIKSEPNKGSEFIVTMYLKLGKNSSNEIEELRGLKVLVVDDDKDALEGMCQIIRDIGMKCDTAIDCGEAVNKVLSNEREGTHYFAALIDWNMPEHDGIETIKYIKQEINYHLPMILVSSYDWSSIESEAKSAGVEGFITKPLFQSRLLRAFDGIIGKNKSSGDNIEAFNQTDFSDKRILIVEDNEINLEIAVEIISYTGAEIESAADGDEAVEKVKNSPEGYYDMIFMDIQMPRMNGYEATECIRNLTRSDASSIPIVAMTANTFADDVQDAKNAGMNDHLAKPIDLNKLMQIMNKWLNKKTLG